MINNPKIIKSYIVYFFAILLPQILMISSKGSTRDTLYKMAVLGLFVSWFFVSMKESGNFFVAKGKVLWLVLYCLGSCMGMIFSDTMGISAIASMIIIAFVFIFFVAFNENLYFNIEDIDKFPFFFTLLIGYACVFNILKNGKSIAASSAEVGAGNFSSFFDNKNTFGLFLFCGVIAGTLCVNHINDKAKAVFSIIIVGIFISLVICGSRTALISSMAFLIIYFTFVKKKNLGTVAMMIIVVGIAAYLCFKVPVINEYIQNHLLRNDNSYLDRSIMANTTIDNIKGLAWIYGYGENAVSYMSQYTGYAYFHNTYIEVLATGGILKCILYGTFCVQSISNAWKIFTRYSREVGGLFCSAWFAYFIYSFGESVVVLNGDTQGFIMTMFLVTLPQLYLNYYVMEEGARI